MLAFQPHLNSPAMYHLKHPLNFNPTMKKRFRVIAADHGIPSFLPKEIHKIKDPFARNLAMRIERLPVQFWRSYIRRPMVLVGPSLGAATAIDFSVHHPESVSKLVLIDANVYSEGIGVLAEIPRVIASAGLELLRSIPLRLYVTMLIFRSVAFSTSWDWMNISRLHCLLPWWRDAILSFMASGGYNVNSQLKQVKKRALIIWGENDQIISYRFAVRLHSELPDALLRPIPDCGHIPHVEKPDAVAKLIVKFIQDGQC